MILRRYGTFAGGIDLPDEKHATLDRPIHPWRRPQSLRVPLAPCGESPATPTVEVGTYVTAGERIAEAADETGVDVFCPVSGLASAVTTATVAGRDGFVQSPAIELTDITSVSSILPVAPVFDWRAASAHTLRLRIAEGGLTTCRRPPRPLLRWVEAARTKRCRTLIVNAMESQPYVTADHRLLVDHGTDVIRGLAILTRAIDAAEAVLAADHRRTEEYRQLVGPARMYQINRIALGHKYPAGADAMLLKVLTRREVPPGGEAADIGAAVIDAATCFAVYRWVACGVLPTSRAVTVAGERIEHPGNFWVPFGTPCAALAESAAGPVLHGGPMVALRCDENAVVGPSTDAVLAIETPSAPLPSPCIRCGWCTDHCPARLNVAALNDHFELGLLESARRVGVTACVECGVCSYVCPARLPLSQRVKQLKRALAGPGERTPAPSKRPRGSSCESKRLL